MAPRRGAPSSNSLSPQDPTPPSGSPSPAFLGLPRSTSPSSGFTQFLSRPSKWFNRSASSPRLPSGGAEPRSSTSSSGRKHKISHPTDPRPLLDTYAGGASKSVLDLSARPPGSLDISPFASPSSPSTPTISSNPAGLGDLRTISRRGWSKSADDLGQVSPANFSPIDTSFQNKVEQYRNRSDSSASGVSPSTPTSPPSPLNGRQPFPTLKSPSPPSASPPRSSTMPMSGVSISISAPAIEDTSPQDSSPTHVHTRSHSFTPRLPSKLSTPRFGPPSPKRKGSSASERDLEGREGDKLVGGGGLPGTPTRSAFPFSFGGLGHKPLPPDPTINIPPQQNSPARSTMLLAPPTIVEPGQDAEASADSKRSSQIVYNSGFINRMADMSSALLQYPPNHANMTLAKGWKPYKLELKGSKLYFYKPPGDRSAAIKELFPTEFVPATQEDEEEEAVGDDRDAGGSGRVRNGKGKEVGEASIGRKKRAFWGRRTHPDLMLEGGAVEKGSFEALVHEAVFATTFLDVHLTSDDGQADAEGAPNRREEWKDFASAILLCLPSLVGRVKFEVEFLRCCSYLLSGAEEDKKEDERSRLGWIAGEYLRCHGEPADHSGWEEWRVEILPDVPSAVVQYANLAGMPTSSSMQALYAPSPLLGYGSPNLGTFSPRPEDSSKLMSLVEALGDAVPPSPSGKSSLDFRTMEQQQSSRLPYTHGTTKMPWAALEQEGLSRDVLLLFDPHLIARSLSLYHRSILEQVPENLTAEFVLGSDLPSNNSLSPNTNNSITPLTPFFAPLFGSEEQPHWLTKILLMQILGADTSTGNATSSHLASPGRTSEDRSAQTSRTHSRSEVISVWARVGELCRLAGDECSWRAIAAALCSRPVARLEKAWKRVDPLASAAIESWVYPAADGECTGVKEPRTTPWGGDIKSRVKEELGKARGDAGEEEWRVEPLEQVRKMFEGIRTSFSLCPRKMNAIDGEIGDDVRRMMAYWRGMSAEGGGGGSMGSKFLHVEQFMSLSLAAEPRRKGLFEPYYWSRSSPAHGPHASLIPLLFPEPLPAASLIDRAQLLRGRVDSDAADIQFLRGLDAHMRPDERRNIQRVEAINNRNASAGLGGVGRGGTVIPVYNGDLLLVVQQGGGDASPSSRPSSRAPSRPPSSVVDASSAEKILSRAPSIRVKPGSSQGLDRKPSVARRNSLPSISQRQNFTISEPSSEPPLRVLVQAGTLNTLVNILVHGLQNVSVSVADDNGEMSLREGMTRELVVDQREFAAVWWNVFRTFVTPLVFFELLRKLYVASQPQGSSPSVSDYLHVAGARSEVLETMKEWLCTGAGAQDILDDSQLFNAVRSFLESPVDHVIHESSNFEESNVRQAWATLARDRRALSLSFKSQTMRPPSSRNGNVLGSKHTATTGGPRVRNLSSREAPDVDHTSAEDLVDNLDGMAGAAFSNVTEEDLFITSDLLEVQTADRIGWFLHREASSTEEAVEVQTMYSHIQEVEPSSMISELGQDAIYRLLPPGIRSCIRAYGILRKWLISKIVAPRLGLRARQARMELFLQSIEVARLRNAEPNSGPPRLADRPCIRSFVEAVITSAVLSVESRMHHRAWQNVALNRGTQCDSLSSLLSKPFTQSISSKDPLTVDMGWLIERMLEVIATPDVVEPSVQEGQSLVNFDKRRHLCSLITKAPTPLSRRRNHQLDEMNRRGFERLNNIEREVILLQFDQRGIKEEAQREGAYASVNGTPSAKKPVRPFHRIIAFQIEKNRRDKNLRSRLQKEKLHEQSRNDKREDLLNKAMRPRKPSTMAQKQHRNKKSMSAFLHFMRPISSAFGAEIHPHGLKRTASELDFMPSGKPSLVLSLVDARVAQFINNERSFTFQLDTEDGGHYLLQAMNRRDMTKWMETINRITKMAAKRRLTYLGNSPKPQLSDHIHNQPTTASRDPRAVFGVELEFLIQREAGDEGVQPGTIPFVIEQCLSEVESRGLSEVGIYRIAGASSEISALKDAFNRGESPIERSSDIHAVCDLIKSWFRVLPEPVFPSSSYYEIIEAMKLENLDARLSGIRSVVQSLPQANFDLLKRVSEHLDKVTDYEEHNQMTAEALAIVFSPNLLRAPQNDFVMILANMGHTHKLVKALITHFHVIFDDVDPEGEIDQDDELDSPILEEDEEEDEEDEDSNIHSRFTQEPEQISSHHGQLDF